MLPMTSCEALITFSNSCHFASSITWSSRGGKPMRIWSCPPFYILPAWGQVPPVLKPFWWRYLRENYQWRTFLTADRALQPLFLPEGRSLLFVRHYIWKGKWSKRENTNKNAAWQKLNYISQRWKLILSKNWKCCPPLEIGRLLWTTIKFLTTKIYNFKHSTYLIEY